MTNTSYQEASRSEPLSTVRPACGYGLALLHDGEQSAEVVLQRIEGGCGCPVLDMAEGALGVLRAMSIRSGPLKLDAPVYTLAYVRWLDGVPVLTVWRLTRGKAAGQ